MPAATKCFDCASTTPPDMRLQPRAGLAGGGRRMGCGTRRVNGRFVTQLTERAGGFPGSCFWRDKMLWTIAVILLILWALGFGFHVAGGLIHLLLVIALIVIVVNLVSGRRAL
jgi:hypothetical protein